MIRRHFPRVRSLFVAASLAAISILATVASVAADSGGGPFPK